MRRELKKVLVTILVISICFGTTDARALAAENTALSPLEEQVVTVSGNDDQGSTNVPENEEVEGIQESEEFTVDTSEVVFETENYKVISSLTGNWEGGFNAAIVIQNTGEMDIRNWHIQFPAKYVIANIWNAKIVDYQEGIYLIKNADWNGTIPAGSCVEFGFSVNESFSVFPQEYELVGANVKTTKDGYEIEYSVTDKWDTGFIGTIIINNVSELPMEDWVLEFDFDF